MIFNQYLTLITLSIISNMKNTMRRAPV